MTFQKYSFADFQKVKEERMKKIVSLFKNMKPEELSTQMAKTYVTKIGAPMESWSLLNRMIAERNNTTDARSFPAWRKLGRKVTGKAFFVWKPVTKVVKVYSPEDTQHKGHYEIKYLKMSDQLTDSMEQIQTLFGLQAEHRIEDTEGKEVKYDNEPEQLPKLSNVAKKLGIKIQWKKYGFDGVYGSYYPNRKKITLSSYDEELFFHELTHAVQHKLDGIIKGGQDKDQETIAEYTACVIADIFGIDCAKKSMSYLVHYNGNTEEVLKRINGNIHKIEQILDYVFSCE